MATALIRCEMLQTEKINPIAIRAATLWQRHHPAGTGPSSLVSQRDSVRTTSDADLTPSPSRPLISRPPDEPRDANVLALRQASTPATDELVELASSLAHKESGLQITTKRLISLLQDEDADEEGGLRPTLGAFLTAWNLIMGAYAQGLEPFPKASPGSDEEGGLRVHWSSLGRQVRLIVPGTRQRAPYIYHEEGENFATEATVSGQSLAAWLRWLAAE